MNNLIKRFAKVAAVAGGMLAGSAAVASAECYVKDHDKRGLFGATTHQRTFSGNSALNIWNRYCMPYIQREIQENGIRNGEFGMNCHGSISCHIRGRLVNGRLVVDELSTDGKTSQRRETETVVTPRRRVETETVVTTRRQVEAEVVVRPSTTVRRSGGIYSDPNWNVFTRMVEECEAYHSGTRRAKPTCSR